ncbi:hypothetical protein Cpir12675_000934 [Ceratocystis pirilliformis]|uniref:Uncharacterized protein n=1 Tax=Ceratocystis pirilliformis TaxID=259994 RepID=A0ABR3ZJY4_9PEZI
MSALSAVLTSQFSEDSVEGHLPSIMSARSLIASALQQMAEEGLLKETPDLIKLCMTQANFGFESVDSGFSAHGNFETFCNLQLRGVPGTHMEDNNDLQERWSNFAEDFGRRSDLPGLMSGNTVIDERNFHELAAIHKEQKRQTGRAKTLFWSK